MELSEATSIRNLGLYEVSAGSTAVLNCQSNDYNHNFMFWILNNQKNVIGPGNEDFDERKYKYSILSGKLQIDSVAPSESGFYSCVSKKITGSGINIANIEMVVKDPIISPIDGIKIAAIVVSILVLIACAVIYYRLRKEWKKYSGRGVIPVDEVDDDEADGDEIYNGTTTTAAVNQAVAGPSRNQSSDQLIYGIDNQGLDTDFNSVFENIQIKRPTTSLI